MCDEYKKKEEEKKLIEFMIRLYCKNKHNKNDLCEECKEVLEYVNIRIENCPYIDTKTYCSVCENKCYSPKMREKIKKIMRWAGPRMFIYHPILAIKHGIETMKKRIGD